MQGARPAAPALAGTPSGFSTSLQAGLVVVACKQAYMHGQACTASHSAHLLALCKGLRIQGPWHSPDEQAVGAVEACAKLCVCWPSFNNRKQCQRARVRPTPTCLHDDTRPWGLPSAEAQCEQPLMNSPSRAGAPDAPSPAKTHAMHTPKLPSLTGPPTPDPTPAHNPPPQPP